MKILSHRLKKARVAGSTVNVSNSYFLNNFNSIGGDAGILAHGCILNTANCLFYYNGAQNFAFSKASCIHFDASYGEISNCTFYGNHIFR